MPARPYPLNVPGDWYVEDGCCLICTVPGDIAPDLFAVNEEPLHCYVCRQPETPRHLNQMLEAAWYADLECIRYRGKSPDIITYLIKKQLSQIIDPFTPHPDNAPGDWYIPVPDPRHHCTGCALPGALPDMIRSDGTFCWVYREAQTQRDSQRMLIAAAEAACGCLRYRGSDPAVTAWLTDQGCWHLIG